MRTAFTPQTAADLVEDTIYVDAPLYCVRSCSGLLESKGGDLIGHPSSLRFPPARQRKKIGGEGGEITNAYWEPLSLPTGMDDWIYGRVTADEAQTHHLFYDYEVEKEFLALVPDIFVAGELTVSEAARDAIKAYAPEYCYFSPVQMSNKDSGRTPDRAFFKVLVRHALYYEGPTPETRYETPLGVNLMIHETWSALCENTLARHVSAEIPIFLYDRRAQYPVFQRGLLEHLKDAGLSGLLEFTDYKGRPDGMPWPRRGWEAVYPLNPGPDCPLW